MKSVNTCLITLTFFLFFLFLSLKMDNHWFSNNWTSVFLLPLIPIILMFCNLIRTTKWSRNSIKENPKPLIGILVFLISLSLYLPFMGILNKNITSWFFVFIPYYTLLLISTIVCTVIFIKTLISRTRRITFYGAKLGWLAIGIVAFVLLLISFILIPLKLEVYDWLSWYDVCIPLLITLIGKFTLIFIIFFYYFLITF